MRFASLGSGSRGNATLIEAGGTRLLIDCGFTLAEARTRLERLGVAPESLSGILVTHEHGDHLGGVARLARLCGTTVYLTAGTLAAWNDARVPAIQRISPHDRFSIGAIDVLPFPVPHDAREPCQFRLEHGGLRLGVLSDAGHVTAHMRDMLSGMDALMLECNHDPQLLARGPYPPSLKLRVGGSWGHLANAQSADLLRGIDTTRLQHLVLTHLSETNNAPQLARDAACAALQRDEDWIVCADQAQGSGWREIA
jgi:phosphoribosyl 1,2-cyclic phosphodiesterase